MTSWISKRKGLLPLLTRAISHDITRSVEPPVKHRFVRRLERLIGGALRDVRDKHGEIVPGTVAKRVASQLWADTRDDAHACPPDWIKHVRGAAGVSQTRFASELGTTQVTVARWETGHMEPSAEHRRRIVAFAQRLGLEPQQEEGEVSR